MVVILGVVLAATRAGFCNVDSMAFSFLDSGFLSRLRRPVGWFHTELLCVLGVQLLPAAELHGLWTSDTADRSFAEKVIQHIERNVPARSTHRDKAAIDVRPKRQARAAAN